MKASIPKTQSGVALLIFLVVLMGIGGLALTGFSQKVIKEVNKERFNHNREVLEQAKHALLMFAYNYPSSNPPVGPGRLPCPDDDNDGLIGAGVDIAQCNALGRLPWLDPRLNIPQLTDATGETLWYAVSQEFRNFAPSDIGANTNGNVVVNSESVGTLSIFDRAGNIIYDGAANGVAAVIIAPGSPLAGQDRIADPLDPVNYLDAFGGFDNSVFVNGSNADADGFTLGPITNNTTLVVNDEVIIITSEEVIAMAEKATLQAYRDALEDYLANTGDIYPWLYDHNTDDLEAFSGISVTGTPFPDGALDTTGRIPSIFSNYFIEQPSEKIDSEVRLIVSKQFDISGSGQTFTIAFDQQSTVLSDVEFEDTGTPTDDAGRLVADAGLNIYQKNMYLSETNPGSNVWEVCQNTAENLIDCNRDSGGIFTAGANNYTARVMWVRIELDFTNNLQLDLVYAPVPVLTYDPADFVGLPQHAEIKAEFTAANLTGIDGSLDGKLYWELGIYDPINFTPTNSADQSFESITDLGSLVSGSLENLSTGNTTIGLRYYPEIPSWAHTNENDWHNSVLMAIASDYQPAGGQDCVVTPPCLDVDDSGGITDDKVSLLVLAPNVSAFIDEGGDGYVDDLVDIFDPENANLDAIYLRREGDDTVLVLR